jgi:tetratricopeptide (TPR) repeat protein
MTANQRYEAAIELCLSAIEIAKNSDKMLVYDCYFLQAVALYRLNRPLDAVESFSQGKRILKRMKR